MSAAEKERERCRAKSRRSRLDPEYRERERQNKRNYRQKPEKKDVERNGQLLRQYGITLLQYNEMKMKQGNACAICRLSQDSLPKRLAVDHCHETGTVRGLLCDDCNTTLGKFEDQPTRFDVAASYLRAHGRK